MQFFYQNYICMHRDNCSSLCCFEITGGLCGVLKGTLAAGVEYIGVYKKYISIYEAKLCKSGSNLC